MMKAACLVLMAVLAGVSAHYDGYPFTHVNDGRYGADYPYANYGMGEAVPAAAAAPAAVKAEGGFGNGYGYGFNHEFNYRDFGAFPVHVGGGSFYYLGKFNGKCAKGQSYGFYFAGDANSFIVCDHGQAHRFECPRGTQNRDTSYFQEHHRYGMHELCGLNTLTH